MRLQQGIVKPRRRRYRSWRSRRGEKLLELDERFRTVIDFGPYRGQLLCRAPNDFLAWVAIADAVDVKRRRVARALLAERCVSDRRVGSDAGVYNTEKAPGVTFKPAADPAPNPRSVDNAIVAVNATVGPARQMNALTDGPPLRVHVAARGRRRAPWV